MQIVVSFVPDTARCATCSFPSMYSSRGAYSIVPANPRLSLGTLVGFFVVKLEAVVEIGAGVRFGVEVEVEVEVGQGLAVRSPEGRSIFAFFFERLPKFEALDYVGSDIRRTRFARDRRSLSSSSQMTSAIVFTS